jgi:hypothetical protein
MHYVQIVNFKVMSSTLCKINSKSQILVKSISVRLAQYRNGFDDIISKILITVLRHPLFITITFNLKSVNQAKEKIWIQELWFQSSRNNHKVSADTFLRQT